MMQQQEKLSAFMDGEYHDDELISQIAKDSELSATWQRYHLVRSSLRKETSVVGQLDLSAQIAAAIEQEPTVLAPRSGWRKLPFAGKIVPFAKQSGQFALAASVAAAVILGVQQMNQPDPAQTLMTAAPTIDGPQGTIGLVSLDQTRPLPQRSNMNELLEMRRQINALIADHEQQIKLKQAQHKVQDDAQDEGQQSAESR